MLEKKNVSLQSGFTLIEMSIVLIIIGLIVGGVLAGRHLIYTATIQSQISQVNKFQQAANTFRAKYNNLPGDIPEPDATQFGFVPRSTTAALFPGYGNGLMEGANFGSSLLSYALGSGENTMFWVDLSTAKLIDGSFTTATPDMVGSYSGTNIPLYFPAAKLSGSSGSGTPAVYVWSGYGLNFYTLGNLTTITGGRDTFGSSSLPIEIAYAIDSKIDDGMPMSGNVLGIMPRASNVNIVYGAFTSVTVLPIPFAPTRPTLATNCVNTTDGVDNTPWQFVKENFNNGQARCALSFKFQ